MKNRFCREKYALTNKQFFTFEKKDGVAAFVRKDKDWKLDKYSWKLKSYSKIFDHILLFPSFLVLKFVTI